MGGGQAPRLFAEYLSEDWVLLRWSIESIFAPQMKILNRIKLLELGLQ